MSGGEVAGVIGYVLAGLVTGVLFARDIAGDPTSGPYGDEYPQPIEVAAAFVCGLLVWPFVVGFFVLHGLGKLLSIGKQP